MDILRDFAISASTISSTCFSNSSSESGASDGSASVVVSAAMVGSGAAVGSGSEAKKGLALSAFVHFCRCCSTKPKVADVRAAGVIKAAQDDAPTKRANGR